MVMAPAAVRAIQAAGRFRPTINPLDRNMIKWNHFVFPFNHVNPIAIK